MTTTIFRSQNKEIREIFAGSFFGTVEIAEMYCSDNDAMFKIEIDGNISLEDAWEASCDIDAGLVNENLEVVGKVDFIEHNWKNNGGYGKTYLSTKNIVLSDVKEIGTHTTEDGEEIPLFSAKGTLKAVSLEEIVSYTARPEYNKR